MWLVALHVALAAPGPGARHCPLTYTPQGTADLRVAVYGWLAGIAISVDRTVVGVDVQTTVTKPLGSVPYF
eukprot:1933052-Prymnesium_polylepis.2